MQSSNTHNGFCVLSQKFCEWCKIFDRDQAPAFWMYALNNDNFKVLMLMMEISWWPKLHSDICKSGLNSDSDLCWVTTRTRTRAHEWTRLNVGIAQKCAVGFDRTLDNQIIQCTSGKGINVKVWYGSILSPKPKQPYHTNARLTEVLRDIIKAWRISSTVPGMNVLDWTRRTPKLI